MTSKSNNLLKLKNIPKDRIRINKMRVGKPVGVVVNPAFHFHAMELLLGLQTGP